MRRSMLFLLLLVIISFALGLWVNWGGVVGSRPSITTALVQAILSFLFSLTGYYWAYITIDLLGGAVRAIMGTGLILNQTQTLVLFGVALLSPIVGYAMWRYSNRVEVGRRVVLAYLAFVIVSGFGLQMFPPT